MSPSSHDGDDVRSLKLRRPDRGVEERLRQFAEEGRLSGLPGEGQPFARADLDGDDARWAAFRLMKQNKVLPAWSQARIEIEEELERLRQRARRHRAWLAGRAAHLRTLPADRILEAARATEREDARVRAELETALRALNVLIERYNAIVPAERLRLLPLTATALRGAEPG